MSAYTDRETEGGGEREKEREEIEREREKEREEIDRERGEFDSQDNTQFKNDGSPARRIYIKTVEVEEMFLQCKHALLGVSANSL